MRTGMACLWGTLLCSFLAGPAFGSEPAARLTSAQLDALLVKELPAVRSADMIGDEQFLRRACLDLIGRQPTPEERTERINAAVAKILADFPPQKKK